MTVREFTVGLLTTTNLYDHVQDGFALSHYYEENVVGHIDSNMTRQNLSNTK